MVVNIGNEVPGLLLGRTYIVVTGDIVRSLFRL